MDGMQILSLVSIAEQQITFFAVAVAAIYLWHDKRTLKRKVLSLEGSNDSSKRPIAIVIGIGNDPLAQVEDFLKDQKIGYIKIIKYIFKDYLQPRDYWDAMAKINKLKDDAQELAATKILLFYAGPVELAVHTGTSFGNWVPIELYAFARDKGTYEHKATLTRETARTATLADQITRKLEETK